MPSCSLSEISLASILLITSHIILVVACVSLSRSVVENSLSSIFILGDWYAIGPASSSVVIFCIVMPV